MTAQSLVPRDGRSEGLLGSHGDGFALMLAMTAIKPMVNVLASGKVGGDEGRRAMSSGTPHCGSGGQLRHRIPIICTSKE